MLWISVGLERDLDLLIGSGMVNFIRIPLMKITWMIRRI
jgi:hypothetical protein